MIPHEGKSDQGPIRPGDNQQNPQDIHNPHPQGFEQQRQEKYRNNPNQQQRDWNDFQRNQQQSDQKENQKQIHNQGTGSAGSAAEPTNSGIHHSSDPKAAENQKDTNYTENLRNQDPTRDYRDTEMK